MPKPEAASGLSVAAFVSGVLWLGPIAIILGWLGLARTTRGTRVSPSGVLAALGLALGTVGCAAWVLFGMHYLDAQGTAAGTEQVADAVLAPPPAPGGLAARADSREDGVTAYTQPWRRDGSMDIEEAEPTAVPLPATGTALLDSLPREVGSFIVREFVPVDVDGALESYRGTYDRVVGRIDIEDPEDPEDPKGSGERAEATGSADSGDPADPESGTVQPTPLMVRTPSGVVVTVTLWSSAAEARSRVDAVRADHEKAIPAKAKKFDAGPDGTGFVIDLGAIGLREHDGYEAIMWSSFTTAVDVTGPGADVHDLFAAFTLGPAQPAE